MRMYRSSNTTADLKRLCVLVACWLSMWVRNIPRLASLHYTITRYQQVPLIGYLVPVAKVHFAAVVPWYTCTNTCSTVLVAISTTRSGSSRAVSVTSKVGTGTYWYKLQELKTWYYCLYYGQKRSNEEHLFGKICSTRAAKIHRKTGSLYRFTVCWLINNY